jgi:hypothetical protein
MSTTARRFPSEVRPGLVWLAVIAVLSVVLVACGGGGGGGGGAAGALKLRVAVINETTEDLAISMDVDGTPGEPQMLATCKAEVYEFDIPDGDWVLALNGQTVIDSFELEANLLDRNLTAEVQANDDGTVTLTRIQAGSQVSRPAQLGICT